MFQKFSSNSDIYTELVSNNPNAMAFIEQHPELIDWWNVAANPEVAEWLTWSKLAETHRDEINWALLSRHAGSMGWLKKNPDRIEWFGLSMNNHPDAIEMLKANPEKINWERLSRNTNPDAIEMLKANRELIHWPSLSSNESYAAIELLKENPDKIVWWILSSNPFAVGLLSENKQEIVQSRMYNNSGARELILKHLETFNEKCKWLTIAHWCCSNPCLFDLVEDLIKHEQEKVDLYDLLSNPAIFEYDYNAMLIRCMVFKDELLMNRLHPDNVGKFDDWGFLEHTKEEEKDEYDLSY